VESVEAAREKTEPARPFKKIYNLHISVSRDGKQARQWAKRNASYGLSGAYIRYPEVLATLGLDPKEVGFVAEAYIKGLGVDEAAKRVSDDLLGRAGNVVAGTPDECVETCREIVKHITALGFDQLVMGVPLGPNIPEAIELIAEKVLPALNPTTKEG
jgi:alkanesulfonate monooxygenase SsuD/methylene tetrahydromethanopterin reductase-like flavin-dependent oxidoreductase (luciferase family)